MTSLKLTILGGISPAKLITGIVILILFFYASSSEAKFPSCKECRREQRWFAFQELLQREGDGKSYDVLFLGDSITESYRGSSRGNMECSKYHCQDIPEMFKQIFSDVGRTGIHGISGDQTAHILWRLNTKEGNAVKNAKAVVLLIGTNDLSQMIDERVGGWGNPSYFGPLEPSLRTNSATELTRRIILVVDAIKDKMKHPRIVLVGILPRGESFRPTPRFSWPNQIYTEIIYSCNSALEDHYRGHPSISFADCSAGFLTEAGIVKGYMTDALHPTGLGAKYLMECSKKGLLQFDPK